jgi:pSer/pThr/pTyr-binding forkhead associated (FHA) protein
MPYLSWLESGLSRRYFIEEEILIGRDSDLCRVSLPSDPSVSRRHAVIGFTGDRWWIRDLGSRNGTLLNGLPLTNPGGTLKDQDEIQLGDWKLAFTTDFPGLDGINFIERVGDLFSEVRPEPAQALVLIRGLELLQRSTEALLRMGTASALLKGLLTEALKLLNADRGLVVMIRSDGSWQCVHSVGDAEERVGMSRSVMSYVAKHRTAVLSNASMADPRFQGASLLELHRGALMCAPMEVDGVVQGMLYMDRADGGRPFTRFDLAVFQAFVRQGALAHHHTQMAQKAIGQAELQGELLRLKSLNERFTNRTGEIFGIMASCLRWLQSYAEKAHGDMALALRHEVSRLQSLVEEGIQETVSEVPHEVPYSSSLEALQRALEPAWDALLKMRRATLKLQPVPEGTVWMAGNLAGQAVMGLVEPLFMEVSEGTSVPGQWVEDAGNWVLRLTFPLGVHAPSPDPWTLHSLQKTGIVWRWAEQTLGITFPRGIDTVPEQPSMPLLGLVTEEYELLGLFQSVAEAGGLAIFPLEENPPLPPLPQFRYLVVDAKGTVDPVACIHVYRRHPNFNTVPILVVRAPEEISASLLAAGANDWLPEEFRWETLHHRLQVLKGHDELQRKALEAERFEAFRKMAGSLKHEINNPLAIISMQVELLQRKYPDEVKLSKVEEMVDRIRNLMQVLQKMREAAVEEYPGGSSIVKLS